MKAKVILDIGFLGHAHNVKSARRGAERVAGKIFDGLRASAECDLLYVATMHLAGAYDFLESQTIPAKDRLFYHPRQLERSRRGRELARAVQRTVDDRSLVARLRRRIFAVWARQLARGENQLESAWLDGADIYHSPHAPFPRAVHEHRRIKKFITLHDFIPLKNPEYFPGNSKPFMEAVLACLRPDNFAFCVSETTRHDTLNLSRIPPEHVFVTPLAADSTIFHRITDPSLLAASRARYHIPAVPYLLALSAHDRHKNFPHLIRCFGALVEAGELRDVNLVIVGPNPGRNAEVQLALEKHPRAKSRVVVTGFVSDEHLAAIYCGATAFLFPSLAEGFGLPPLEAMQCGTPVIASNTTSIPEVVGDAGLLLPPTDEDAWCQAMLKICRDEPFRLDLAERSLARSREFSWERFHRETLRGYQASLMLK